MVDLLVAACSLCCAVAPLHDLEATAPLQAAHAEAVHALRHGDPQAALRRLQPLLVADGIDPVLQAEGRFVAAEAAQQLGEFDRALNLLSGLETSLPAVGDYVFMLRARSLRQLFLWAPAGAAYRAVLRHDPQTPLRHEAAFGIADSAYARGAAPQAIAAYRRALLLRDGSRLGSRRALLGRMSFGRLLAAAGQRQQATRQLREVIKRDGIGDLAALAQLSLRPLLAPHPTLRMALQQIDELLQKRSVAQAAAAIDAALPLAHGSDARGALQARRALLHMRRREWDAAIALWRPLVGRSHGSSHRDWARHLAGALAQTQQIAAATLMLSELARDRPNSRDSREARYRAAWLTYQQGDLGTAHRLFGDFVAAHPRDPQAAEATWYLAWTAYRGGNFEAALAAFDKLARRPLGDASSGRLHYWRGQTHRQLGELALAKQSFARAARSPLSYYGQLASQRQAELGEGPVAFSSLGEEAGGDAAPPPQAPLPQPERVQGGHPLPWGTALQWQSPAGRRIAGLLRLGMVREACRLIPRLPPAHPDGREVAYSRAALLQALGDDAGVFRLASIAFAHDLHGAPTGKARRSFVLAFPRPHAEAVRRAADDFGIAPELVLAVMRQESGFDAAASSWANARGLMQVIPPTARHIATALDMQPFVDSQLEDPDTNIRFGAWYLAQLLQEFHGNLLPAVASYNAGPTQVKSWLQARGGGQSDAFVEDIPFRETRDYVKNVAANFAVYTQLWSNRQQRLPQQISTHWRGAIDY